MKPLFVFLSICLMSSSTNIFAQNQNGKWVGIDWDKPWTEVKFDSEDGLEITADLYAPFPLLKKRVFIVLCHQGGWSRGEYRGIARMLIMKGYGCLAIDQRSGGVFNNITNQTAKRAIAAKKGTNVTDAEQDMIAAVKWARANHATGKLVLWGSSYSSSLALRIAGEHPELVDGVLAFAPGEDFEELGKPKDWITSSAKKIECPVFITSAQHEWPRWQAIYEAIPGKTKAKFVPETKSNHGSMVLAPQVDNSAAYRTEVLNFMERFH